MNRWAHGALRLHVVARDRGRWDRLWLQGQPSTSDAITTT